TFWKRSRERILEKNQFGRRSNDAGPIWMGLRLNTFRSPFAYQQIVYPKGGYILHMLRSIMWDNKNGDKAFMEMMQDCVSSNLDKNGSTESFKHCVEKHMSSLGWTSRAISGWIGFSANGFMGRRCRATSWCTRSHPTRMGSLS